MSTPSPKSPPTMPTMVSRLPKFGLRTKSAPPDYSSHTATANGNSGRLANGIYHQPSPPALGSCTPLPTTTKQNGFLKEGVSASMKWKSGCDKLVKEKELSRGKHVPQQTQGLPAGSPSDSKKPVVIPTARGRGFGFSPTSLPSPQPQSDRRALPIAKAGSNGPKSAQSVSALPSGRKPAAAGMKALSGSTSSLRRPQSFTRLSSPGPGSSPGSRSSSPLPRKPPASRCHSSEALGSTPSPQMVDSDRLRSRSFTQAQRQTSPTFTPPSFLRRPAHSSYSFNRRDVKDTGSRGTVAKPTGSSRLVDPGSKGHKPQSSAPLARPTGATPTPSPLSSLKKPLLPSVGSAPKHSGISYKLSRPSLNKQSRPLKAPPTNEQHTDEGRPEQISVIKHSPERPLQPLGEDGLTTETASQCEMTIAGETLEDMSLSSNSSLDKNDVSQEYMDDFDNLANGGLNLLLLSSKNEEDDSGLDQSCARFEDDLSVNGVIKPLSTGLSFLEASVEWNGMKLNGEQRERRLSQHQRRSSQLDYHEQGGSSLDLSPSDSCGSGGTYMWDEEGLEPLRGTATTTTNSNTTHHIGSFDSDLNSIDLLNNLESCDLDDDDLMLDADVSEDASLHSDGDAISHMAQWRRRQLCWGTQEAHDNSDHQRYKLDNVGKTTMAVCRDANLILDLCSPRSPQLSPGSPGLGMDVEELAEDCCEVRSQLEHLQRLLLQEEDMDEDTLTTDTLSPDASHSSSSCNTQVEVLLQEVQQLREELRSRDQTILQLNQQLTEAAATTRCRCLETKTGMTDRLTQTSRVGTESVASQTPWKEQASQILHSSSCDHQGPLTPPPPAVAPPPAEPRPSPPPLCTDPPDGGATQEERKGAGARCLRQPSKLRRFLSQRPSPVAVVTEASSTKQ